MIKSDLSCTSLYCRHNDQGVCVIRVPYYPGEKIDHCTYFEPVSASDTGGIDDQEGRKNHESPNRNH